MKRKVNMIRLAYWLGALIDGYAAVQLIQMRYLIPSLNSKPAGWNIPASDMTYGIGQGVALMLGWTSLLVWGSLRPIERRGVLLITVIPVMVALIFNTLHGVLTGISALEGKVFTLIIQSLLMAIFIAAYWAANRIKGDALPGKERASGGL